MKRNLSSWIRLAKTAQHYGAAAFLGQIQYEVLRQPVGQSVLVLAPHPDDDVIGCGGTIAQLTTLGRKVRIAYRFDVTETRWTEAVAGAKILGVLEEALIKITTVKDLKQLLESFKPDTVYLPSILDNHAEHQALHRELLGVAPADLTLVNYEVWTPVFFNKLLPIDDVIAKKQQAMRAHKSQLKDRDYVAALTGLAEYRAASMGVGKYAESYLVLPKAVDERLCRAGGFL